MKLVKYHMLGLTWEHGKWLRPHELDTDTHTHTLFRHRLASSADTSGRVPGMHLK